MMFIMVGDNSQDIHIMQYAQFVHLAIAKNAALAVHKETDKISGVVTEFRYAIDNGYLLENGKRISMPGNPDFFVQVLELEVTQP